MHPRTEELVNYLARCGRELAVAFAAVPETDLRRRVDPSSWTAAEVMHHVALLELHIRDTLDRRLSAARAAGLGVDPLQESILGCLSEAKIRNRGFKVEAPAPVQPLGDVDGSKALTEWRQAHAAFEAFVRQTDGAALAELQHPHPVLGPLDFYQWIAFVGAHELRHADQIVELSVALRS